MFRSSLLVAFLCAASALAAPSMIKRQAVDDTTVLNFALTLEHLESTFYNEGLAKFDEKAFEDAGYPFWVRGRYEQIAGHEATHVQALTAALGDKATKACEYNFPYNDVKGFVALSMVLETVGASAYTGAAQLLSNKDTLTTAASILNVESRQAAWISSAVLKGAAWDSAFETPLGLNGVFSLASQFITKCPSTDPTFPVADLPALTVSPTSSAALAGTTLDLTFTLPASDANAPLFLAYFNGLTPVFSDIQNNGGKFTTTAPSGLHGTTYVAVVKSKDNASDATLSTGLAMLEFEFSSFDSD